MSSSSKDQTGHRHQLDPLYACIPKYQNTLPAAPSGPFFQKVKMNNTFKDYGTYGVSSLEKSYVWQPHLGADVGLGLNLVDPEKILQDPKKVPQLHPDDLAIINATSERKSRVKLDHHPSWLMKHVPVLKNIMNKVTDVNAAIKRRRAGDVEANKAEFQIKNVVPYIESSFASTKQNIKTLQEAAKDGITIEYISDLLPDFDAWESDKRTLVRYEEDPFDGMDNASSFKLNNSIFSNFKGTEFEGEWSCALTAPLKNEDNDNDDDDDDDDDDDSDEVEQFEWVRNFRVKLGDIDEIKDTYAFRLPNDNDKISADKTAPPTLYCPLRSKLTQKRIKSEGKFSQHSCRVGKRKRTDEENAKNKSMLKELGIDVDE